MKLSQLLHKVDNEQLFIITEYNAPKPAKILVRGKRQDIKKDNPYNSYHVRAISYYQAYMLVQISKEGRGAQQ